MKENREKTAVITGATSGIGLETARGLLQNGCFVIGIGRSREKCNMARLDILEDQPDAAENLHFLITDLSSQRHISGTAQRVAEILIQYGYAHLDILINNAGTVSGSRAETEEGFELQWAVNHLAPFLLTHQLLPMLRKSPDARLLTVSSQSHRGARIHWKDPNLISGYNPLRAYKQSKLANVLFTNWFNQLFQSDGKIRAFAVDPGLVRTEIGHKNTSGIAYLIWSLRQKSARPVREGAATSIFLAVTPRTSIQDGAYWKHCRPIRSSSYSRNMEAAQRLWKISERMCGISYQRYLNTEAE